MNTTPKQLYTFLSGCAGNWRNAVFVTGTVPENSSDYLLSADRDGRPIVMAVEQFQQFAGEQVDPAECCGQLSVEGFKTLYAQYLLWHMSSAIEDPLCYLSRTSPGQN